MTQPVPPILYKYMSTDRESFFEKPQLRFTPSDKFKALYECAPKTKAVINPLVTKQKIIEQSTRLSSCLTELAPFSQSNACKAIISGVIDALQELSTKLIEDNTPLVETQEVQSTANSILGSHLYRTPHGVLCLTSDPANTIMWEQYAKGFWGGHCGFVAGFDTTHSFFHRQTDHDKMLGVLAPVCYPQYEELPCFNDLFLDEDNTTKNIFFTKDPHLAYEKEWRIVTRLKKPEKQPRSDIEDIPPAAIKEIYLGVKACESLLNTAKIFCNKFEIDLFRMVKSSSGRLVPEQIVDVKGCQQ